MLCIWPNVLALTSWYVVVETAVPNNYTSNVEASANVTVNCTAGGNDSELLGCPGTINIGWLEIPPYIYNSTAELNRG